MKTKIPYAASAALILSGLVVLTFSLRSGPPNRTRDLTALKADRPKGADKPFTIQQTLAALPLRFEANQGQTDERVSFLARGPGYSVFLTPAEAVLTLRSRSLGATSGMIASDVAADLQPAVVRMKLMNANEQPKVTGLEQLPSKSHYFKGNDPSLWRTDIANFAKVRVEQVLPGIDLLYYGNGRQLEYDLIIAPGADPGQIDLAFEGVERIELDIGGDLVLHVGGRELRQTAPKIYQEINGVREPRGGRYVRNEAGRIGVDVAAYDTSKALVIDPTIVYATYFGGSSADSASAVAVDAAGAAYLTGRTHSPDFPIENAFQGGLGSTNGNAYVAKIDPSLPGTAGLIYSTYLGGDSGESGLGIAVDVVGNAYVTGQTLSQNFPVTPTAYQGSTSVFVFRGDAFLAKLNPTGNTLLYSTYLGRDDADLALGVAVDLLGMAYIVGGTQSPDFPTTPGAFQATAPDGTNAFLAKFDTTQAGVLSLVYSTYLGGSLVAIDVCCGEETGHAIAVDPAGNAYVTGWTNSVDFPTTPNAAQPFIASLGGRDAFVSKLNASGSALLYSTYLGGGTVPSGYTHGPSDEGRGIAIDAIGNAYVTGITASGDFPTTPGALQSTYQGGSQPAGDAFVTKVDTVTGPLVYSTYLGGGAHDEGRAIAVNSSRNAFVTGIATAIIGFPGFSGSGAAPVFVTKMNTTGTAVEYSEFIGATEGNGIALNAEEVYVTGTVNSDSEVPTTPDAFQVSSLGGGDAFLVKFGPVLPTPTPTETPTPTPTETPTPTPSPSPTPTPTPFVSVSGTISYCSNPVPGPVPNVTLTLTGTTSDSTLSDGSGNYTFSALLSGGNYTVTPTKAARLPGSANISTQDVIATQRHFLGLGTPLSGCRLMAADVNGDTAVNTSDVIAIQRFFLGLSTGIANVGKYKFTPVSRTYTGLVTDQTAQNYDTVVFGDTAASFVELVDGP